MGTGRFRPRISRLCLETENNMATETPTGSELNDLKDGNVPLALYWSYSQVADWIQDLGFPQYKVCLR